VRRVRFAVRFAGASPTADFTQLFPALLDYKGGADCSTPGPGAVTAAWLRAGSLTAPTLVPASAGAALGEPPEGYQLSVEKLAATFDPDLELVPIDVATQRPGPRWTVHQWLLYWRGRTQRELLRARHELSARRLSSDVEDEADSAAARVRWA
jgi:hypothetical protein